MDELKDQENFPGSITYFNRDWLYPLHKINSGHFSTVIDAEGLHYIYARLEISSGYDSMTLSFDLTDDLDYKDGLAALYKIRDAIDLLAKEVVAQRETAILRAKNFNNEEDI